MEFFDPDPHIGDRYFFKTHGLFKRESISSGHGKADVLR